MRFEGPRHALDVLVEMRMVARGRARDYVAQRGQIRAAHCTASAQHRRAEWSRTRRKGRGLSGRPEYVYQLVCATPNCRRVWPLEAVDLPWGEVATAHRIYGGVAGQRLLRGGAWEWVQRGQKAKARRAPRRREGTTADDLLVELQRALEEVDERVGERLAPGPRAVLELDAASRNSAIRNHPRGSWGPDLRAWLDGQPNGAPHHWRDRLEELLSTGRDESVAAVGELLWPDLRWSPVSVRGFRRHGERALAEGLQARGMLRSWRVAG